MTISIWRYSHLALAVSSFILLTLASITGIILAFEPVSQKMQPYRTAGFNQITLSQSLPLLRKTYPNITELNVDANQFVQLKGTDAKGKKLQVYIDARSGKILGVPQKQTEFFQWVTGFHRSLFLHRIGRFFIGLTSFLLLLITVSGSMLIIQRQRSFKRFFAKIARDNFAQYYHVVLGRLSLLPIIVIALTGTYLSLTKFGFFTGKNSMPKIDFDAIRSKPILKAEDFTVFKQIKLAEVQSVEFPFSEDAEDYYTLKLQDRELTVNQITGDVLSEINYPATILVNNLSLNLHTGRTSAVWAVILAIASANILFFIYSGFAITLKRIGNRTKNKFTAQESNIIILVGSENGDTFRFAQNIHQQLLKQGEKSYLTGLNNYTVFTGAKLMIVMTATYGLGEAPANAAKFINLLGQQPQLQPVKYSVLGFGSQAYPDFCKFAFDVSQSLSGQNWAAPLIDVHTVNDKSPADFRLWAEAWSQQTNLPLDDLSALNKRERLEKLTVVDKTINQDTFLIQFKAGKRSTVTSGDLLAVYPANDHRERLYSIGLADQKIQLSVRLHPQGLGSGFLHGLTIGTKIRARIISNKHFHFPKKATEVVMISNGTGIAPFLGMIDQNTAKTPCHLYCGFRENAAFKMYEAFLEGNKISKKLTQLHVALSREGEKNYISSLVLRDADLMLKVLNSGGVLMICGSLSMQKDVLALLEKICQTQNGKSVSFYQSHSQILMDCY